jgi:hypothetical protein
MRLMVFMSSLLFGCGEKEEDTAVEAEETGGEE